MGKSSFDDNSAPDQNGDSVFDVWSVAVSPDDIRRMTVDQMDEALDAGAIDTETLVWRPGMREWSPLRKVAGLDADRGTNIGWLDDSGSLASLSQVWSAPGMSSSEGTGPEAAPVRVGPNMHGGRQATAQTSLSLAPVSIPAASPGWATIPRSLPDERKGMSVHTVHRFRAARWFTLLGALAIGGVLFFNKGPWLELLFSRLDAAPAERSAAPAAAGMELNRRAQELEIESAGTLTNGRAHELETKAVAIPTFRIEGSDLVRMGPVTSTQLGAAESHDLNPEADRTGEPQAEPKRASPRPARLKRLRRSGTVKRRSAGGELTGVTPLDASGATVKEPASERAGSKGQTEAGQTDSGKTNSPFDPLDDALP